MSTDTLSELFTFTPKKIPPFPVVKSGFKYYPAEPIANGNFTVRVCLYDETLTDVSELNLILTSQAYETYHQNVSEFLIAKLGLKAMYIEPVLPEPEPVQAQVEEPEPVQAEEPVQAQVEEPAPTVVEIKPVYDYLILDGANRMVFPQGFARNASLEIVDTEGVPIVFAQMKLRENNTPLIYNLLPTNAEHIPSLPQGASKTSEGHILTPDGSEIVITYPQFVVTV